jgi:solute carrier family 26 protein
MAYSLLGGVPPIVGIYMAFFPVLLYVLMGTSRHVSMGWYDYLKFIEVNEIACHKKLIKKGKSCPYA